MTSISSKREAKPICSAVSEQDSSKPLFQLAAPSSFTDDSEQKEIHKLQNWEESLFFKQIKRDREEYNSSMGRKYNLNFNKEDIFDVKDEDFDSSAGKRSNVVW